MTDAEVEAAAKAAGAPTEEDLARDQDLADYFADEGSRAIDEEDVRRFADQNTRAAAIAQAQSGEMLDDDPLADQILMTSQIEALQALGDRQVEAFDPLSAIALVRMSDDNEWPFALAFATANPNDLIPLTKEQAVEAREAIGSEPMNAETVFDLLVVVGALPAMHRISDRWRVQPDRRIDFTVDDPNLFEAALKGARELARRGWPTLKA
jgi:hypothetical protein